MLVKSKHGLNLARAALTPDAASLHAYHVFYQVMDWKNLSKVAINPEPWGWQIRNDKMEPIMMDQVRYWFHILLIACVLIVFAGFFYFDTYNPLMGMKLITTCKIWSNLQHFFGLVYMKKNSWKYLFDWTSKCRQISFSPRLCTRRITALSLLQLQVEHQESVWFNKKPLLCKNWLTMCFSLWRMQGHWLLLWCESSWGCGRQDR